MFGGFGGFGAAPAPAAAPAFGGFGGFGAPAVASPQVPMEKVPTDATDRTLYSLDRAMATGVPALNPDVAKQLQPALESAERPLSKARDLLRPYRKTEHEALDRLPSYAFRCVLWEKRDGEPRLPDPTLMTNDEWRELYGDSPRDVQTYADDIQELQALGLRYPLQPVPVDGFDGLKQRLLIQQRQLTGTVAADDSQQAAGVRAPGLLYVAMLATKQLEDLEGRAEACWSRIERAREKSRMQLQRLLKVAQQTEMVAFPSVNGYGASRSREENRDEQALRLRLTSLLEDLRREHQLGPRIEELQLRLGQLQARAQALAVSGRAVPAGPPGTAPPAGPTSQLVVDEGTRAAVSELHTDVQRLQLATREAKAVLTAVATA